MLECPPTLSQHTLPCRPYAHASSSRWIWSWGPTSPPPLCPHFQRVQTVCPHLQHVHIPPPPSVGMSIEDVVRLDSRCRALDVVNRSSSSKPEDKTRLISEVRTGVCGGMNW